MVINPKLIDLLRTVERTRQEHELTARLTGENFNVFNILGLSTAEVRTHSAFLAELLNPKGSHGQGSTYLELFLKMPDGAKGFRAEGAMVTVEYHIGGINLEDGTGGRIDILLTDADGRHIVIENKVYAGDQDSQMLRYHNAFPDAFLYYLNLHGGEPRSVSMGGKVFPFTPISYRKHILEWLEECHKASVSLPVVRETILQYTNLVRRLTGQTTGDKVKEDAKRLILDNPDLAEAVPVLWAAWQSILLKVRTAVEGRLGEVGKTCTLDGDLVIQRSMPIDCGGLVVAFRAVRNGIAVDGGEASRYADILKGIVNSHVRSKYWNVGWFSPDPFGRGEGLDSLPKRTLLTLHEDDAFLDTFAGKILERTRLVTDSLLAGIRTFR